MLKKYFIFPVVGILSFGLSIETNANQAVCEAQCLIYDGTPEVLTQYIQDTRTVVRNITTALRAKEAQTGVEKDFSRLKNSVTRGYNLVSNWDGYYSYFKFYVPYSLKNEFVGEVWRDYDILNYESDGIERYIKSLGYRGYQNTPLTQEEICNGVASKCNFSGDALDVLISIAGNNEKMKDYYRKSIMGDDVGIPKDIQLVQDNFGVDFKKYYNTNTTLNCSMCDGSYWSGVSETMDRISQNMENAGNGIEEWQNAWALLIGGLDEKEEERIERQLLKRELGRQGVTQEQGERILQNLDEFNTNGLATVMSNNFISNSVDYFIKMIAPQTENFSETFMSAFGGEDKATGVEEKVTSIGNFNTISGNVGTASFIEQSIAGLYQEQQPYLASQSRSLETTISKLIEMHYNINKSVEYLQKAEKLFEGACKYQANGRGNCD